jgi:GntR family transcriptional regulator/MocR family aminotransferase
MAGGVPDVRLVPARLVARAFRTALSAPSAHRALGYGDPRGEARLLAAIADLVRTTRGIAATADDVFVARGSQMALDLVARAVVPPGGGVVAVEAPGYPSAWAAFGRAGARVVPIAVDARGIDVDALSDVARRETLHAVYVTPHHQYPTTVTLTAGRRLALLDLARRKRFAIVEDDYDHELHYDGRPVMPLASADVDGSVVYVGTLSKVLAPGLRLGYVVAPRALVERLARERLTIDRQGDHVGERAVAELIEDGVVARHVRRIHRVYQGRRDHVVDLLRRAFGDALDVRVPPGGLTLWARVRLPAAEVVRWERRALARGVAFTAGQRFTFDGRAIPFARFGFAALEDAEADEAVRRLRLAFGARRGVRSQR